jgi:hypothetical protein
MAKGRREESGRENRGDCHQKDGIQPRLTLELVEEGAALASLKGSKLRSRIAWPVINVAYHAAID